MTPGVNGRVRSLIPLESGAWLAGGWFDEVNGFSCASIVRLAANGEPDPNFALNLSRPADIWCVAAEPDGRLLVGGAFNEVNGARRNGLARLQVNGQLDSTFDPGTGMDGTVTCFARDGAGHLWAGGSFVVANGHQQHSVANLSAQGEVIGSYKPCDWLTTVYSVLPLANGSLLAGGDFWYAGGLYHNVVRLKPDGALDFSLPLNWGANSQVRALLALTDGRVLMGGLFDGVAVAWHKGVARLKADGSVDSSFNVDLGSNAQVFSLQRYPGSKVLAGGTFYAYNTSGLIRLASDGTVDNTLSTGVGPDGAILGLAVQTDGKILAVGQFTHFNGTAAPRIVRLYSSGSLDPNFHGPTDINALIRTIAIQPGGGIIIGGRFSWIGGRPKTGLVRLIPESEEGIILKNQGN